MCGKFTEVFLLISLEFLLQAECLPTETVTVNCMTLNTTVVPVPIVNSRYSILPNGDICCPEYRFDENGDYCISDSDMADLCNGAGIVYEPCYHCKTCGKKIGERCHGTHYMHGHCGNNLVCIGEDGADLEYSEDIGACTTPGGPPTNQPGMECGGDFNSLGFCEPESKCRKGNSTKGVCIKNGKTLI